MSATGRDDRPGKVINTRRRHSTSDGRYAQLPAVLLRRPEATAETATHRVEAELRTDLRIDAGVVRITNKRTGRRVTICGDTIGGQIHAEQAAHHVVGAAADVLRKSGAPQQQAQWNSEAVTRVFNHCLRGLTRHDPSQARPEIVNVAAGMSRRDVPLWFDDPYWSGYLTQRGLGEDTPGYLSAAGWSPAAAGAFSDTFHATRQARFPRGRRSDLFWVGLKGARMLLHAHAHLGWRGAEAYEFTQIATGPDPASVSEFIFTLAGGWLRLPAGEALLCARAGLSAAEAAAMHENGTLDKVVLRTMAGLH